MNANFLHHIALPKAISLSLWSRAMTLSSKSLFKFIYQVWLVWVCMLLTSSTWTWLMTLLTLASNSTDTNTVLLYQCGLLISIFMSSMFSLYLCKEALAFRTFPRVFHKLCPWRSWTLKSLWTSSESWSLQVLSWDCWFRFLPFPPEGPGASWPRFWRSWYCPLRSSLHFLGSSERWVIVCSPGVLLSTADRN